MGRAYERERMGWCLMAAALEEDIRMLPKGLTLTLTLIGY